MTVTSNKLTKTQLEILKTFAYEIQEEELQDLKKVLVKFFADRIRSKTGEFGKKRLY